jgi:hypothetical protein
MDKKIIISVLAGGGKHYEKMEAAARETCFKNAPDNMSIYYVHNSRTWDTNVTSRVTDAMKNDKTSSFLHIKADNQTFGDTAPDILKQLCVEYLIDNEKLRHVVSEGETLKIVVPASKKFVITEANYGPPDYKDKIGIGDGQTKLIDDCFYYGGPASRATLLRKCIEFWGYCLENLDFDYIFRPNLGCWVSMDALNKLVNTLPMEGVYGGSFGTTKGRRGGIEFVSGSGFLLSRDVVQLIWDYHLNDKDITIEYNGNILIDDVAIGAFLSAFRCNPDKGINIKRTLLPRIDLHEGEIDSSRIDPDCHHYYFLHPKSPNCYYKMRSAIEKKEKQIDTRK